MSNHTDRAPLDLDAIKANDYRPDRNAAAAYRQSDLAAVDVPALVAEVEQLRRGGEQLGKVIDTNAEIMRATVLDGTTSPRLALERLADWLAEADALTPDEHSRIITSLREAAAEVDRRRAAEQRVRDACDEAENGALRWEDPLPVPEWVAVIRRAIGGGAS